MAYRVERAEPVANQVDAMLTDLEDRVNRSDAGVAPEPTQPGSAAAALQAKGGKPRPLATRPASVTPRLTPPLPARLSSALPSPPCAAARRRSLDRLELTDEVIQLCILRITKEVRGAHAQRSTSGQLSPRDQAVVLP